MPRSAAQSTLAYLFSKLRDDDEDSSKRSITRKVGRNTFKHEAGTNQDRVEEYMHNKCDCRVTEDDMLLEKHQMFRLRDAHKKYLLKNSAAMTLKRVEVDMSSKSKISGRPNVMAKWLETRYDQPPPEDYEFRHCLKSVLTFDPMEKAYTVDDVTSDYGEPALEKVFLDPPPMKKSSRKNAFGAIQLCPHSLKRIMGDDGTSHQKRDEHVIDFLTIVASLNQDLVQPRVGSRRAESLYFESMFNSVLPK